MIILLEDRLSVAEAYQQQFKKKGEEVVRLLSSDMISWINTSDILELLTAEAILVGECSESLTTVKLIKQKLKIPIIALLENRSLDRLIEFYHHGVDDVVVKPVHIDELLIRIATIKRRLSGIQIQHEETPISVFYDGRDPVILGNQLSLPRRERRILEYLASINGRRATKSQLFGAVYGLFDEHIDENVIESHICKLRKKLRDILSYDPIDCRRYLGYRLDKKHLCAVPASNQFDRIAS